MFNPTQVASGGWDLGGIATLDRSIVIDDTVTSWATLAAKATTGLSVGHTIAWVEAATLILKVTQLLASTDATDTAEAVQRPNDYNASTNAKVWFGISV